VSAQRLTRYGELADVLEHMPLILREIRRVRGASLREVARQTGLSFATVHRIEASEDCVLSNAVAIMRWLDGGAA